jgi:hypothetical protein
MKPAILEKLLKEGSIKSYSYDKEGDNDKLIIEFYTGTKLVIGSVSFIEEDNSALVITDDE